METNDADIILRATKRILRGAGAIVLSGVVGYLTTFLQTDPEIKEISFYTTLLILIPILQGISKYIRDKFFIDFKVV